MMVADNTRNIDPPVVRVYERPDCPRDDYRALYINCNFCPRWDLCMSEGYSLPYLTGVGVTL